ncbi:jg16349 [Pararge aegeria aegeria]|uniref:Jg16349 protein n=1 Tax=Pararge aegeria aegeria TaxID=348720 RepID=A0A8S4RU08_9NEOP|nr:jg16349 [Pararge aegeria aegeria]
MRIGGLHTPLRSLGREISQWSSRQHRERSISVIGCRTLRHKISRLLQDTKERTEDEIKENITNENGT